MVFIDTFGDEYFEAYDRFYAPSKFKMEKKAENKTGIGNAIDIYEVRRILSSCDRYELMEIAEMLWCTVNSYKNFR